MNRSTARISHGPSARNTLLCSLLLALAACRAGDAPRFERFVLATPVVRVPLDVAPGERITLQAVTLDHARVVLHLWDPSTGKQVAHAASFLWRRNPSLKFRNERKEPRRLEVMVRAARAGDSGRVDVLRDGKPLLRGARLGAALLKLATGSDLRYVVAAAPDAANTAQLWGLDADGGIVGYADDGSPTELPQLAGNPAITSLLLAAERGHFHVYANDLDDRDGDGVGRLLERALGLCDSAQQKSCRESPLAELYRAVSTRDSDRDGLSDADELFGAQGRGLDLPRYGVDPRHKDVLVEVDHDRKLQDVGLTEQELREIAALFEAGSASDLKNPDGEPGVRLHFDVGFAPQAPEHASLFGDWGGSGPVTASEYRAARKRDFTPARPGYFRYAFVTRHGRGQAHKDAFTVNRDLQRVNIFAHELGHTLGLTHYGHERWGKRNCKPNYYSIMNYLYQYRYELGFSLGATHPLNPARVLERDALQRPEDAALLRETPLELDVLGFDVDWNRDGLISDVPVRANLLWATYKSCGAAEIGMFTLAKDHVAAATPVLLSSGQQLLAFWLDDTGQLWLRRRQQQGELVSWSVPSAVLELSALQKIAGVVLDGERVALAYVTEDGALNVGILAHKDHPPRLAANGTIEGAWTEHTPAIARFELSPERYGVTDALGVLYRSATSGQLELALAEDSSLEFVRRAALDGTGAPIQAASGPSVTVLPSGERCSVVADAASFSRFYCYDAAADHWLDLSGRAFDVGLGPRTGDAPGLAYHLYRDATGAAISDDARGALVFAFSEPAGDNAVFPNNPHLYLSEWLSQAHGARERITFRWRGRLINEWTQLAPGTGVALHEGPDHLHALLVQRSSAGALRLDFLPYADGERDEELSAGNDFEVMERGICLGIRSQEECGGPDTAAY